MTESEGHPPDRENARGGGPPSESDQWVSAGICLTRVGGLHGGLVAQGLPWLTAVLGELGGLPPPGLVVDVARIVAGAPLDTSRALPVEHARLRHAIARYEDGVLGGLVTDPRLGAIRDAHAALAGRFRALSVAIVVARLASTPAALAAVPAGILRRLSAQDADAVLADGLRLWREGDVVFDRLADAYEALVEAQRARRVGLTPSDLFALENLTGLGELGQRVAIAQVVDAAEALAASWPRRMLVSTPPRGSTSTVLEAESTYPVGGFSSMARHGTWENLVASELVFMDTQNNDPRAVDLFDVRYAENELLYYTRDESLIVRPRRVVAFILEPCLAKIRLKDPGMRWQRIVLVLGWLLAAVRCLTRWLGEADLQVLCVFERDGSLGGALAHEEELARLLLRPWRDNDVVQVLSLAANDWQLRLSDEARRASVSAVIVGVDPSVAMQDQRVTAVPFAAHARDWHAWCQDGLSALRGLL